METWAETREKYPIQAHTDVRDVKNGRISIRLLTWFLVVSIAPLAIFGYIAYTSSVSIISKKLSENLTNLAEVKAAHMEFYMRERRDEAAHIASAPHLVEAISRLTVLFKDGGAPTASHLSPIYEELGPDLNSYIDGRGFEDMILLSPDGRVLYSASMNVVPGEPLNAGPYAGTKLWQSFESVVARGKAETSDFEYNEFTRETGAFLTVPVTDSGRLIGVMALRLSSAHINEIVADYNEFAETGETLLGMRVGEQAVFITPVRHDPGAAFRMTVPLDATGKGIPMHAALNGESGSGVGRDYRGVAVLAAWKYIPALNWGLVIKVDSNEAFAPVRRFTTYMAVLGVLAMAIVSFFSLIVSQSIASPIASLTQAAERIKNGDLTAGADLAAVRDDEIGGLVKSFKTMVKKRMEAEAELERSNSALECVNTELSSKVAELDEFCHVVSHDLQEPLRGLAAFCAHLRKDLGETVPERVSKDIYFISEAAERMQGLVRGMLALSSAGRASIRVEPVSLDDCVDTALKALTERVSETGAVIVREKALPRVLGDKLLLTQLFQNLIANAIKFSTVRKIPIVNITHEPTEQGDIFGVMDNGIGIAREHHGDIFAPFKKLHARGEYEGHGIGLSVCGKIIERHKGAIWVESEPGKGAHFRFTLRASAGAKQGA